LEVYVEVYNWKILGQSKRDFDCCLYIDRDVDKAFRRFSGLQPCQVQQEKYQQHWDRSTLNLTRLHLLKASLQIDFICQDQLELGTGKPAAEKQNLSTIQLFSLTSI